MDSDHRHGNLKPSALRSARTGGSVYQEAVHLDGTRMRHWRCWHWPSRTLPIVAASRNRGETTASATRLSGEALKTFPRSRRDMYQPCHLITPPPAPRRRSPALAVRRFRRKTVAQGVASHRIVFRQCQRSGVACVSGLPPMNARDPQATVSSQGRRHPFTRPKAFEIAAQCLGTGVDQAHRTAERKARSPR